MAITCFLFGIAALSLHLFFSCSASAATLDINSDRDALLAFKQHITLDPLNYLATNWSANTSVCSWIGVSCGLTTNFRVTSLNLSLMGLTGTIPPHIGNLSFLSEISLANNSFHGPLPTELVHLPLLRYINFRSNNFSQEIPSWLGSQPKLEELYLDDNNFLGTIPASLYNISTLKTLQLMNNNLQGNISEEIGNLANLETLNLNGNKKISGSLPWTIFNISSLKTIDLANNMISGGLPDDMCKNLPNLQALIAHHNQLVGQIPSSIGQCGKLLRVYLNKNAFTGNIPISLGNLTLVQELSLGFNNLTGEIPEELGSLLSVEQLVLRDNFLSGPIPKSLFNCTSLFYLSLGANDYLKGPIPSEIGKLRKLMSFIVRYNNFSGTIPSSLFNITTVRLLLLNVNRFSGKLPLNFGHASNLEEIYLTRNQISGPLPASFSNASKLTIAEMSSNFFSGPIPNTLGNLRNLQRLNLAANLFTGESSASELSFLSSLANCKGLTRLVLVGNPLNGTLPTSIGNFSAIRYFNVETCNIKGSIPREVGHISNLTTLLLQNNELIGSIPDTIGRLQKLQVLYLQGNKLNGSLPNDICQMNSLGELILSRNNIYGTLPACLGDVNSLRSLRLDSNNFISTIPSTLWNLKDVLDLNLSSNSLSGHLPLSIGNLKVVTQVDLSSNHLSGIIPDSLGGLQSLMKLSLRHNNFEGPIPESFGNLISLEALDLANNNLSGTIPKSLEGLKYLKYLNLSFNKLEGEVPTAGTFVNFSAMSFLGNNALCGSPFLQLTPCKISNQGRSKSATKQVLVYLLPAIILTIVVILVSLRCRKTKVKLVTVADPYLEIVATWRRISFQELQQATDGFCDSNLLGRGGSGTVYKGRLSDGMEVAIKVFNLQLERAFNSFDAECEVMSNIRHRNLVKIISCCSNNDFKALVLDYMPNGSLEKLLYSHNYCLDILQRLDIMIDVALALEYLHHGFSRPIVHCDLKPSNVLLDANMVAHVADFGIAKLLGEGDSMTQTRTLATIGYMAPEYGSEGIVSTKGDVYSFGILLMETFTRKKPTDDMFGGRMSLKEYIKQALPDAVAEIADVNLLTGEENFADKKDCLSFILGLAVECCVEVPDERNGITQVLSKLITIRTQFLASLAKTNEIGK
ncbi:receptor kinase-like protein Xa21 [Hevea brasiliensis]|uniref:receptor kinase-like protein Xa21 n=1 Tax=Hevea brasiliensis TaxID=3981 RepID=UPI0025E4518F|nr:receptor kinase-like protein Xa21 [Hevea brasiliensis]